MAGRVRGRGESRERMSASLLYESPFTDVTPQGPDGLFTTPQLHELLGILDEVRATAMAA